MKRFERKTIKEDKINSIHVIYASCFETNLLFPVFCTSPDREIQDWIDTESSDR
ncbi:MAG: hypothetical protein KDK54_21185 [Leptospiraceae bacterium]|nr:hypothetical protein [Leptospiraceae bacterium]